METGVISELLTQGHKHYARGEGRAPRHAGVGRLPADYGRPSTAGRYGLLSLAHGNSQSQSSLTFPAHD